MAGDLVLLCVAKQALRVISPVVKWFYFVTLFFKVTLWTPQPAARLYHSGFIAIIAQIVTRQRCLFGFWADNIMG